MIVATKAPMSSADILLNSNKLNVVETFKYLRVTVDSCLNWERHISQLIERVSSQIALLNRLAGFLDTKILLRIYKQTILPLIGYGCIVWHECNKSLSDKLERLQNQAMRVILRANRTTCTQYMRNTLGLLTLYNRRRFLRFVFIFKIVNNQDCPKQLEGYLTSRAGFQNRNLRNQGTLSYHNLRLLQEERLSKLLVQVTGTHSLRNLGK